MLNVKSDLETYLFVFVIACVGGMIGWVAGEQYTQTDMRNQAIELGHAYFHPKTGGFTWRTPEAPEVSEE